jgi:transposase-like protein
LAARVLTFDDYSARNDAVEEAFELLTALTYSRRDGIRRIHVAKRNLKWQLHRILHSVLTNLGEGERLGIDPAQSREASSLKGAAALP